MEAERPILHRQVHDDPPDPRPFRLLDLPRELRDRIYKFMLVRREIRVRERRVRGYMWCYRPTYSLGYSTIDPEPFLKVFKTCRQVYDEAKHIFYSQNLFAFEDSPQHTNINIKLMKSFLYDRMYVVPSIRSLSIIIEEKTLILPDEETKLEGGQDELFGELCSILGSICQLKYLCLHVRNRDKYLEPKYRMNIDPNNEPRRDIPAWVKSVAQIKGLNRLRLTWSFDDVFFRRPLASAKLMRSTMVQNGNAMNGNEGIRATLRHHWVNSFWMRKTTRASEFEMDIEKGKSNLPPSQRRVKVHPDEWCTSCGRFLSPQSYECGNEPCSKYTMNASEDVWDSQKWGSKPLQDYLPEGVTVSDFHRAEELAEAGFSLQCLSRENERDYADSDFGDTDSLLTVHGWSDEEEVQ